MERRKNTVSELLVQRQKKKYNRQWYQMHGSQISVKTLDLNQPFAEIANQMDKNESHFSGLAKEILKPINFVVIFNW